MNLRNGLMFPTLSLDKDVANFHVKKYYPTVPFENQSSSILTKNQILFSDYK